MTINQLVKRSASKPLDASIVGTTCKELNMSENDFYDAFARHAAGEFLKNFDLWDDCDMAMNHLFGFASAIRKHILPDFAFSVYLAFDAGEVGKPDDPKNFDTHSRTKEQLTKLGFK